MLLWFWDPWMETWATSSAWGMCSHFRGRLRRTRLLQHNIWRPGSADFFFLFLFLLLRHTKYPPIYDVTLWNKWHQEHREPKINPFEHFSHKAGWLEGSLRTKWEDFPKYVFLWGPSCRWVLSHVSQSSRVITDDTLLLTPRLLVAHCSHSLSWLFHRWWSLSFTCKTSRSTLTLLLDQKDF